MSDAVIDSWDNRSDEYFMNVEADIKRIKEEPSWAFPRPVYAMIREKFPDLHGKRVLVPSSGGNEAVYGFHMLGAKVTSADISERQIFNAKHIADSNGWDIEFLCADSMNLDCINDGEYDLVYTSNGVHVWIHDLLKMYGHFHRALRSGGSYIMFETHPFDRPFDTNNQEIVIIKPYENVGPFGNPPTYAWRIQDIFNSVIKAGFTLEHMEEFHPEIGDCDSWWDRYEEEKFDWNQNPWAALPQWIGISAAK